MPASERAVQIDDPLPDELRAAAAMRGVQDIDGAWLKFCGYHAGRVIHVPGQWQLWYAREATQERRDRDQGRRRVSPVQHDRGPRAWVMPEPFSVEIDEAAS